METGTFHTEDVGGDMRLCTSSNCTYLVTLCIAPLNSTCIFEAETCSDKIKVDFLRLDSKYRNGFLFPVCSAPPNQPRREQTDQPKVGLTRRDPAKFSNFVIATLVAVLTVVSTVTGIIQTVTAILGVVSNKK